jgi:CopG family nickel-responsive transcriptional regulator
MTEVVRFGVSIDEDLLERFDELIREEHYSNRSEAIRDLIRENLVKREWIGHSEVAGAITIVYNHSKRGLLKILTDIQHEYHHLIISTQHIHLNNNNCLEVVVVKGKPKDVEFLSHKLKSTIGVKHCSLTMTTTGGNLK